MGTVPKIAPKERSTFMELDNKTASLTAPIVAAMAEAAKNIPAAESARLASATASLNAARAIREIVERQFPPLTLQQVDLSGLARAVEAARRAFEQQPLMVESMRQAMFPLFSADFFAEIRQHQAELLQVAKIVSTFREQAVMGRIIDAHRELLERYQNGELEFEPEAGDALEQGNNSVLSLALVWKIIRILVVLYPFGDDYHDDRVSDERFAAIERHFAEVQAAIEETCPDYLFALTALNLRSEPSTEAKRLQILDPKTIMVLIERRGGWLLVELAEDRSQRGWVCEAYVEGLE